MASDRANPRIAYEKSCCFNDGLRAYPIMREPKTDPIPAPDPATPTVAAPAPMNLAAESMSRLALVVWRLRTAATEEGCDILSTRLRPLAERLTRAMADIDSAAKFIGAERKDGSDTAED